MSRTALVTGATGGIGRIVAAELAGAGYALTLTARHEDRLRTLAAELEALGAAVRCHPADLTDDDQVRALAAGLPRLDALVIAAGAGWSGPLDGYPAKRLRTQLTLNTVAPFQLLQHCLPALRAAAAANPEAGAKVVAVASITGVHPEPGLAAYGASKAALVSLCASVNAELATEGVTATAISPGYVDTDMTTWVRDRVAPDRMIPPADVARMVTAVLSMSARTVVPHVVMTRAGSLFQA